MNKKNLYIKNLQFYWRLKTSVNEKNIVHDLLPFRLGYKNDLDLFTQEKNKKVQRSLKIIYKEEHNVGNMQDIGDWFPLYKKDFLNLINYAIDSSTRKIKRILEVGCGACVLLTELKKRGYSVIGIDPSILSRKEGRKGKVRVIVGFYPDRKIVGKFDLICHSDVLEHTSNPLKFLKHNFGQLKNGGMIVLTVPDNTVSIARGDISMLCHQHVSYFDKDSLKKVLMAAGFTQIHIEKARFGGSLNAFAKRTTKKRVGESIHLSRVKLDKFLKENQKVTKKFKSYVEKILEDKDKTLGFYAPIRSLPYLALMNLYRNFRFFDDTSRWHLKYLDGINIPVENFEDLKNNPVSDLIIMSPTFGEVIEKKIKRHFLKRIKVRKISDFF